MREMAFLYLWSQGLQYKGIANRFGIAEGAARQCGLCVRRKLGVPSVDAAADLAKDHVQLNLPYLPVDGRAHRRQEDQALLSQREMRVLETLAEGRTYGECALRLGLSLSSVYNAAYEARQKTGVSSNLKALARAREADAGRSAVD
jgi:DNA-binding CsgD family transcriptional regulator